MAVYQSPSYLTDGKLYPVGNRFAIPDAHRYNFPSVSPVYPQRYANEQPYYRSYDPAPISRVSTNINYAEPAPVVQPAVIVQPVYTPPPGYLMALILAFIALFYAGLLFGVLAFILICIGTPGSIRASIAVSIAGIILATIGFFVWLGIWLSYYH